MCAQKMTCECDARADAYGHISGASDCLDSHVLVKLLQHHDDVTIREHRSYPGGKLAHDAPNLLQRRQSNRQVPRDA